jgi:hypothetical protein
MADVVPIEEAPVFTTRKLAMLIPLPKSAPNRRRKGAGFSSYIERVSAFVFENGYHPRITEKTPGALRGNSGPVCKSAFEGIGIDAHHHFGRRALRLVPAQRADFFSRYRCGHANAEGKPGPQRERPLIVPAVESSEGADGAKEDVLSLCISCPRPCCPRPVIQAKGGLTGDCTVTEITFRSD